MVNYANGLNEQSTQRHNTIDDRSQRGDPSVTTGTLCIYHSQLAKRKWWFFQPLSRVARLLSRFPFVVVVSYPNTSPLAIESFAWKQKQEGARTAWRPLNGTRCGCNEWGFKWGFKWVNDIKLSSINYKTIWWLWELALLLRSRSGPPCQHGAYIWCCEDAPLWKCHCHRLW